MGDTKMNRICIIIRVYNRVEDLKYCLDIIRQTWLQNQYFIIIAFNGGDDGFVIDTETLKKANILLTLQNNTGHFSGNSTLLTESIPSIPEDCLYTVILEADTWLYGDALVDKYIGKLNEINGVWASAQFFRYVLNVATDFAIVKTELIKNHPEIFRFKLTPEYYIGNYLKNNGHRFLYIKENMPVQLPRYIKKYPFAPNGRFFSFPKGKMVTHHIEKLAGGMTEKLAYFNLIAGEKYFDVPDFRWPQLTRLALKVSIALTTILPYKSWFVKRKTYSGE